MSSTPAQLRAAQERAAKYGFHHSASPTGAPLAALAGKPAKLLGTANGHLPTKQLSAPSPAANAPAMRQSMDDASAASGGGGIIAGVLANLGPPSNLPTLPPPVPHMLMLGIPLLILRLSYIFPRPILDSTGAIASPSWGEYVWLLVATLGWFHKFFGLPDGWSVLANALGIDIEANGVPVSYSADRADEIVDISPSTSTSSEVTLVSDAKHPLLAQVPGMLAEFLRLATETSDDDWENVVTANEGGVEVKVWKYKKSQYCFKMLYDLPCPLGPLLDISADSLSRKTWDDMVDDIRILETISRNTRVEYVRAKPVFPTAARDVVLLSHLDSYPAGFEGEGEPEQFMHVTKSVNHASAPNPKGVVRMSTSVAGRIFTRLPNGSTRSLQIADLNPGGSVPNWVVNFVASKAVPKSVGGMWAILKKNGWEGEGKSRLWRDGLAGKGWVPPVRKAIKSASGEDVAEVAPAVEVPAPIAEEPESSSYLAMATSAVTTTAQTIHDALEWSSPFLMVAVTVALVVGMRSGDVRIEVGGRRSR